jgi:uncharacterized membrane protein YcaP (DUF421 family)
VTISESLSAISPVNKHPTQMSEQELDNNKMDIPKHQALIQGVRKQQALIQGVQKQQAEEQQEGKKPDEKRIRDVFVCPYQPQWKTTRNQKNR